MRSARSHGECSAGAGFLEKRDRSYRAAGGEQRSHPLVELAQVSPVGGG